VRDEAENLDGLRRDLLAITNLFCCTTTGVASNQELKELVFDTLIVDEASRVTDAEFLIGATRTKRWILVGDEQQLPPYVEQSDEHFIHALSALNQSEATGKALEQAADELGLLWEEDEELHQFRRTNVVSVAEGIRDSTHWQTKYRDAYQAGLKYLRVEVDDPSRSLLRAMRDNVIHSLFERVVGSCPAAMRVRLVEQRRMIEPLAAIVSMPVYGGDYSTPSTEELARHRVIPLTTPTFPTPITFLDTSMYRKAARDELRRNSFINTFEADWIVLACNTLDRELAQAGSGPVTVSILSFYKAQAKLIGDKLDAGAGRRRFRCLKFSVIDAIDRIQGQESDVVFLSFCRTAGKQVSPSFGQWLQDLRRLNVACTRAHRALLFVGQKELLEKLCSNAPAMNFYRHLNGLFDQRPGVMRVVRQFGNRDA
jgi:superfamily I DNA and/or RNA helicase